MSIYQIITQLQATSSRLDKESILKDNSSNVDLKNFFYNALEPRLNFYIRKIPHYVRGETTITLPEAMYALGALSGRSVTGNNAIQFLSKLLGSLTTEDALMLERVINKDPKCNVSTSIVNKIWSDLVTDIPYMRCSLPTTSNLQDFEWDEGVYSQLKCDGMFINANIDSVMSFTSRNGSPFPIDKFIPIIDVLTTSGIQSSQLHGEIVVYKKGVMLSRKVSNGIMNSVLHGEDFPPDHQPRFHVWDIIPLKESVAKNKYASPYKVRFGVISAMFGDQPEDSPVQVVETKIVHSYEEAMTHYKEVRTRKLEGTIIKRASGIWEDTTSKNCVKMKAEVDIDLKIVGFNPGAKTSKHAHLFGSVQLESECGMVSVAATGMSDDLRADVHSRMEELMGTIVTIRTNELFEPSKNNKLYSLFLPRIIDFRKDKTVADTLQQIKDQFDSVIR